MGIDGWVIDNHQTTRRLKIRTVWNSLAFDPRVSVTLHKKELMTLFQPDHNYYLLFIINRLNTNACTTYCEFKVKPPHRTKSFIQIFEFFIDS